MYIYTYYLEMIYNTFLVVQVLCRPLSPRVVTPWWSHVVPRPDREAEVLRLEEKVLDVVGQCARGLCGEDRLNFFKNHVFFSR